MSARAFVALVLVTLLSVIATAIVIAQRERAEIVVGSGEPMFPGLADRLDGLATIAVRGGDGSRATIRRHGNDWRIDERGGHPADVETVRALVLGLLDLRKVEAKTAQADRYGRIGVADLDAEGGSTGRQIDLLDADGAAIARLIVGDVATALGGEPGRYVRVPDERPAWLVRGAIDPASEPSDWLPRTIVDVPAALVQAIRIEHPDGDTITARRDDPEDTVFAVAELPAEARLRRADDLDGIAGVLAPLELDDVAQASELALQKADAVRTTIRTFDGLVLTILLNEIDGRAWARLSADSAATADADAANARAPADAINARSEGWAYRLPPRAGELLQRRLDALSIADSPPS